METRKTTCSLPAVTMITPEELTDEQRAELTYRGQEPAAFAFIVTEDAAGLPCLKVNSKHPRAKKIHAAIMQYFEARGEIRRIWDEDIASADAQGKDAEIDRQDARAQEAYKTISGTAGAAGINLLYDAITMLERYKSRQKAAAALNTATGYPVPDNAMPSGDVLSYLHLQAQKEAEAAGYKHGPAWEYAMQAVYKYGYAMGYKAAATEGGARNV